MALFEDGDYLRAVKEEWRDNAMAKDKARPMVAPGVEPRGSNFGRFDGTPITQWCDDGESILLIDDFTYFDPRGKKWTALKGSRIDGASIPRAFWTFIGSPYNGSYRPAAIIHDYFCDNRTESPKDTHFMFYEACRASGVESVHAKTLYYAVHYFGPVWGEKPMRSLTKKVDATQLDVAVVTRHVRGLADAPLSEIVKSKPGDLRSAYRMGARCSALSDE